jgi:hypothetical protein
MSIEAIFFTIRSLLLEWSGQLIFLGLSVHLKIGRHLNYCTIQDQIDEFIGWLGSIAGS